MRVLDALFVHKTASGAWKMPALLSVLAVWQCNKPVAARFLETENRRSRSELSLVPKDEGPGAPAIEIY